MELYLRCLCVGVLPPPYTLQGMDTWLRSIPRACVAMRPSVLCYLCDRVHVSVFAYRGCDGLAPLTIGGADQALAVLVTADLIRALSASLLAVACAQDMRR